MKTTKITFLAASTLALSLGAVALTAPVQAATRTGVFSDCAAVVGGGVGNLVNTNNGSTAYLGNNVDIKNTCNATQTMKAGAKIKGVTQSANGNTTVDMLINNTITANKGASAGVTNNAAVNATSNTVQDISGKSKSVTQSATKTTIVGVGIVNDVTSKNGSTANVVNNFNVSNTNNSVQKQ
ncbi:MAG: hypothetical protein ACRCXZ_05690 [Patescibacteria group bacterium]